MKSHPHPFQAIKPKLLLTLLGVVICFCCAQADPPNQRPLSPAEAQIRDSLGGKPIAGSNDMVLDEVLNLIQKRGSILDGSSLDTETEPTEVDARRGKARAAEQLLKSARLLEVLSSEDPHRSKLIDRMRAEAAKLLTE